MREGDGVVAAAGLVLSGRMEIVEGKGPSHDDFRLLSGWWTH